jgi:hypothetical protein
MIAAMTEGIASLMLIRRLQAKRMVASAVPTEEDILFVAIAICGGSPASKYAGSEINPPPPPIASTRPAKNTSGHTIIKVSIDNFM